MNTHSNGPMGEPHICLVVYFTVNPITETVVGQTACSYCELEQ